MSFIARLFWYTAEQGPNIDKTVEQQKAEFDKEEKQLKDQHEKDLEQIRAEEAYQLQQLQDNFDTQAMQSHQRLTELAAKAKLMESKVNAQLAASNTETDNLFNDMFNIPAEDLNNPDIVKAFEKKISEMETGHRPSDSST